MKKLSSAILALFVSLAATACAVEDEAYLAEGDEVIELDDADALDEDVALTPTDEDSVTAKRAPQDEPVVTTPPSRTRRCYSFEGFATQSRARSYCRTGISGAGELVSSNVTRGGRGYNVRCCFLQ